MRNTTDDVELGRKSARPDDVCWYVYEAACSSRGCIFLSAGKGFVLPSDRVCLSPVHPLRSLSLPFTSPACVLCALYTRESSAWLSAHVLHLAPLSDPPHFRASFVARLAGKVSPGDRVVWTVKDAGSDDVRQRAEELMKVQYR